MKSNKKNAVIAFSTLAITVLTLNIGLIRNDVYSKEPEKKGTMMEGSLGTFCCCPGILDCGAALCNASACKSVIEPPTPNPN
jgi:hypothetical protein